MKIPNWLEQCGEIVIRKLDKTRVPARAFKDRWGANWFLANDRWITPFEFDRRYLPLTFNDLLKMYMRVDLLREAISKPSPIFSSIPKDSDWKGGFMELPL